MWFSAGTRTTSSTTTRNSPAGTPPTPMPRSGCCRPRAARFRSSRRPRCFWRNSPAAPKPSARAAPCGACWSARRAWAMRSSAAAEFEFFMFDETPQSIRDKGYRQLKTMTPGAFGYSVLRSSVHADLYHELLDLSQTMRFPIEGLHTETGPGVLEAALDLLRCARSRRSRRAVQDFRQGARAAPRPDGDLHGQVVQQRAGPERPSAHFAARRQRRERIPRSVASRMRCRMPCAGSSAASRR